MPALVAASLGVVVLLARRAQGSARVVPDLSPATALCAVGLAAIALSAIFGLWLCLIGAGIAVLGGAGVVRELRAGARERA